MPSKNSINRPKLVTNLKNRAQKTGLKRSRRDQRGEFQPARSSEDSRSGEIKSVALDLYFQNEKTGGSITNKTLSKKRSQKIERNLKYAQQRKLLTDLQAKSENGMDVDSSSSELVKKVKETKTNKLSMIKKAMWNVLDDTQSQTLPLSSSGQGTTLGGAWFP